MWRPNTHVHKSLYNNKFAKKMSARSDCKLVLGSLQRLSTYALHTWASQIRLSWSTGFYLQLAGEKQGENTIYVKKKTNKSPQNKSLQPL